MNELTIVDNLPSGHDLRLLTLNGPLPGHAHAGQYAAVQVPDGQRAFLALANLPGKPVQLLVKRQGEAATAIADAPIGARLQVSDAMGAGFQLPDDLDPMVLLVAGSGLSAVRPLIHQELGRGRPMRLLFGVYTLDHRPFVSDLEAWERAGVQVDLVLGDPPVGWTGMTGFVQNAARELGLVRGDLRWVLCGFPQMIEECRRMWAEAGLEAGRVYTNF